MPDVKRSVVITEKHDRFLLWLAEKFKTNRSWAVRKAIDNLMAEHPFFLDQAPTERRQDDDVLVGSGSRR